MTAADPTPEPEVPPAGAPPTGVAIVDDALAGLDGVDRLPVDERVPAFERAHDGLRRALDEDPGQSSDPDPGDDAGA